MVLEISDNISDISDIEHIEEFVDNTLPDLNSVVEVYESYLLNREESVIHGET